MQPDQLKEGKIQKKMHHIKQLPIFQPEQQEPYLTFFKIKSQTFYDETQPYTCIIKFSDTDNIFFQKPEALWMLEFTHCQDCGLQRQQGNFCPLCDKCYSDDDFESKMVHCVQCDHWVHAECQGITLDQYECLSDLPEEVQFICRQCCSEQETLNWYKELMEEMEAGYERVKSRFFFQTIFITTFALRA